MPELVVRKLHDAVQKKDGLPRRSRLWNNRRVGRYPHKSALGERASGPTTRLIPLKPRESRLMVYMVRPGEGDQQIDVEQDGHQLSSRARWTISKVIGLAPGETENTGKPPSIVS